MFFELVYFHRSIVPILFVKANQLNEYLQVAFTPPYDVLEDAVILSALI